MTLLKTFRVFRSWNRSREKKIFWVEVGFRTQKSWLHRSLLYSHKQRSVISLHITISFFDWPSLVELFFQSHDLLDFLDPECHALWTHLESRLEVFRKTKALVILAQVLLFLSQAHEFLGQGLEFLGQVHEFLVQANIICLYNKRFRVFLCFSYSSFRSRIKLFWQV